VARDRADEAAGTTPPRGRPSAAELRLRLTTALAERLSPERTRRATLLERLTVRRLSWHHIVRLNRYLEVLGKTATCVWVAFVASIVLGFDWRDAIQEALNSGQRLENALALALVVPTLVFLAARSMIGFARWRLQRELWRRDVERFGAELRERPPA
jgi:hypothetical protein